MITTETIVLTRQEVATLLKQDECIGVVEKAFCLCGLGKTTPPGILGIRSTDGAFHIKAGILNLGRPYFAAKINSNFLTNVARFGLPLIQGVLVLSDGETGRLLAIMDSIEITILRTGAATAVAAKYLSLPGATVVTICGCGNQGRVSLEMLTQVRTIKTAFVFDVDKRKAEEFADQQSHKLKIHVEPVDDLERAVRQSQICVTCTPSKKPFLKRSAISPGLFIAAVGADDEGKQELETDVLAFGKIVADLINQSAAIGELHHAIEQGLVTHENVHAELGEIVAGIKKGRTSDDEVIIFDSTGMALQDVAAASIVYERAIKSEIGLKRKFA